MTSLHSGAPRPARGMYAVAMLPPRHLLLLLVVSGCRRPSIAPPSDTDQGDSSPPGDSDPGDTDIEHIPDGPDEPGGLALFDESSIPEFEITLSEAAMRSLRVQPYEWVSGSFTWGDQVFENVGIRTKGSSSWQSIDDKPSLKINFDMYVEDQRIDDLSQITLNNMASDASMMHERVAYRMYREAGVPARRCHHAHLTLNGEDYGLYAHTESATRKMMVGWYDKEGALWEFWDSDLNPDLVHAMERKFGDEDRSKIEEATELMRGSGPLDLDAVEAAVDFELFQRYWAMCIVVTQYDGYPYRYPADDAYVYHDPDSDQLKFMPHGVDEAFYYPDHDFTQGVSSHVGWKCTLTPGCTDRVIELVFESLDTLEDPDLALLEWVDQVQAQIDPYVQADPKKPFTYQEVLYYQAQMRQVIAQRRAVLEQMTGRGTSAR